MNHQIFEHKLRSLDIQGACRLERLVKLTHSVVTREPQAFDDAWLSMYLNLIAIVKVSQKTQLPSVLTDNQRKQFNSVPNLKEQIIMNFDLRSHKTRG